MPAHLTLVADNAAELTELTQAQRTATERSKEQRLAWVPPPHRSRMRISDYLRRLLFWQPQTLSSTGRYDEPGGSAGLSEIGGGSGVDRGSVNYVKIDDAAGDCDTTEGDAGDHAAIGCTATDHAVADHTARGRDAARSDARDRDAVDHAFDSRGVSDRGINDGETHEVEINDRGAVTAEYVIVIMAAVAFAGLLVAIMRSGEIRQMLVDLVQNALGSAG